MLKLNKNEDGVTIIALIVSIVVMIILAGISINAFISEDGIIQKSKEGKQNVFSTVNDIESGLNELYEERRR